MGKWKQPGHWCQSDLCWNLGSAIYSCVFWMSFLEQVFSSLIWNLCYWYGGGWLLGGFIITRAKSRVLSLEQHEWWIKTGDITASITLLPKTFLKICFIIDFNLTVWCLYRHSAFRIFNPKWYSWAGQLFSWPKVLRVSHKLNPPSKGEILQPFRIRERAVRSWGSCRAEVPATWSGGVLLT